MTYEEFFKKIEASLEVGELYHLEFCIPPGYPKDLEMYFRYKGKVGAGGNLFHFVAEPGGWTVSLGPFQLANRLSLAVDDMKKRRECEKRLAMKGKKNKRMRAAVLSAWPVVGANAARRK